MVGEAAPAKHRLILCDSRAARSIATIESRCSEFAAGVREFHGESFEKEVPNLAYRHGSESAQAEPGPLDDFWPADSSGHDAALLLDSHDIGQYVHFVGRGRPVSGGPELHVARTARRAHPLLVAVSVVGISVSGRSASGRLVSAKLAVLPDWRFSACAGGGTLAALVSCVPGRLFPGVAPGASPGSGSVGRALLWALGILYRAQCSYHHRRSRGLDAVAAAAVRHGIGIACSALHHSGWTGCGNDDSGRPLSDHPL